jgi:hypothetical protein
MRYCIAVVLLAACAFAKDQTTFTVADEVENALHGVAALRDVMRDPDSLVIEHVYAMMGHKPDHPMQCIVYRARNGFNGYDRTIAEYKGGKDINSDASNNFSHCGGIQRWWDKAVKHGWAEITEEYAKAASAKDQKAAEKH